MRTRTVGVFVVGSLLWICAACGDDDGGPSDTLDIEKPTLQSGDQQTGRSVGQGGSLGDEQVSDAEGIASVVWTLGPDVGEQEITASVEGADGSPLIYTALATPGSGPTGPTIQVVNNAFDPELVTINVGETVTWVWAGGASVGPHNVQPDDGVTPERSGDPEGGPKTYSYTFNQIGDFRYYCQTHGAPNGVGMHGRVIVQPAGP
jgi:plastocyanin